MYNHHLCWTQFIRLYSWFPPLWRALVHLTGSLIWIEKNGEIVKVIKVGVFLIKKYKRRYGELRSFLGCESQFSMMVNSVVERSHGSSVIYRHMYQTDRHGWSWFLDLQELRSPIWVNFGPVQSKIIKINLIRYDSAYSFHSCHHKWLELSLLSNLSQPILDSLVGLRSYIHRFELPVPDCGDFSAEGAEEGVLLVKNRKDRRFHRMDLRQLFVNFQPELEKFLLCQPVHSFAALDDRFVFGIEAIFDFYQMIR